MPSKASSRASPTYGNKLTIPRIEIRRSSSSSSVALPIDSPALSAASSLLSLHSHRHSDTLSAVNLYAVIARYRCCLGAIRLRVGACLIGGVCIALSVIVMCTLLVFSTEMSKELQDRLSLPVAAASLYQIAASMILIVGVLLDRPMFVAPFIVNCAFFVLACMALALLLIVSSNHASKPVYPVLIACLVCGAGIYSWFLIVSSMTFALMRDKKKHGWESGTDERAIERVSSSFF